MSNNVQRCQVFGFVMVQCLIVCGMLAASLTASFAATQIDSSRVNEIAAMLPPAPTGFGQPIANLVAWQTVRSRMPWLISDAEKMRAQPEPEISDDLYLDYSKTGNRDRGQKPQLERMRRLAVFTLAECVEDRGRYLSSLQRTIEALCQERSWTYPAHDGNLDVFEGRAMNPDLRATTLALDLATADYLLAGKLPGETHKLIRENVRRRVLQPFRGMVEGRLPELFWLRVTNNWNAVCLAGTTGAALTLEESPRERAWFVAAAEHYMSYFLKSFTADGYCGEGLGYWNYGFGHFILLTEEIRQATAGKDDLFQLPQAAQPALFGFRSEIINGIFPTISDATPGVKPDLELLKYIAERFDLTGSAALAEAPKPRVNDLAPFVMSLFQEDKLPMASHVDGIDSSPLRTWFDDAGVLICRPGGSPPFAAVLKGGHNAENHNHNDVGSFSVVSSNSMVICDPGAEVYTRRTFSAQRYDSKVINSFGHAVPIVAGQLQKTGASARAVVLHTDFKNESDVMTLDIRSAYPVPELEKLERTFVYRRGASPSLSVSDDVVFDKAESFESALITWGKMQSISTNEFALIDDAGAVRVKADCGGLPFSIHTERIEEDVHTAKKPWHIGIALQDRVTAKVAFTISPYP
ncbi:MAG: hypothetical protein ACLQVY_09470 [Limisphaerales bacterium]